MPFRDNNDQIDPSLITVDPRKWWASGKVPFNWGWRRKDKIRSSDFRLGDFSVTWEKVPGWKNDAANVFGHLWTVVPVAGGRWLARPVCSLKRGAGDSLGVSVPLANPVLPAPGQEYGVFIMGAKSNARSAIRKYKRSSGAVEPPDPGDDPPDPPDDPGGNVIKPTASQIRVPGAFRRWMLYPSTLDIGEVSLTLNTTSIDVEWSRRQDLQALKRYEEGKRFGRACFGIYVAGEWVGIHGEHIRKEGNTDETGGTTLDMWGAPDPAAHTTLGQTMRAKSKDRVVEDSGYEPALPMVFFVVTHDENPRPQRTPLHYFGFPAGGGGGEGGGGGDPGGDGGGWIVPTDAQLADCIRRIPGLLR